MHAVNNNKALTPESPVTTTNEMDEQNANNAILEAWQEILGIFNLL